jgi:sirohydrochlorin ferrochelatase
MVNCVVCRYWSERLEETRTHRRGKNALEEERRLMVALRTHQIGACACRLPDLLKDLAKQELPDKAHTFCDPARARIFVDGRGDELGVVPTFGWQ